MQAAFAAGLRNETLPLGQKLLSVIDDYDTLLSSNGHFMVRRSVMIDCVFVPWCIAFPMAVSRNRGVRAL